MNIEEAEERLLKAYRSYFKQRTAIQIQMDVTERLALINQGFDGRWNDELAKARVEQIESELRR